NPSDNMMTAVTITIFTGSSINALSKSLILDFPLAEVCACALKYQLMAIRYAMIRTKILFPRSPNAARANGNSPLYSRIKGKQDNPGAREGNNSMAARYCDSGTLNKLLNGSLSTSA